jgi:uncharacterized protein involved in exopolysaccharide biosynthesis
MKKDEIVVRPYLQHALPSRRDVAAKVFRHWKSIVVVGSLIVVATILAGMWTPTYESQIKILVESRRSDAVVSSSSVSPVQFSGNTVTEEDLNSEVELLKSDDLLRKVALNAGLAGKAGDGSRPTDEKIGAAAHALSRALSMEAVRKTHVISVRYRSRDPKQAAVVLAALASAYVEKHTEVHRPSGEFKFFDQEAARFRKGIEDAQAKLASFSVTHHVVSAQAERDTALQQASEFDSKAEDAQALAAETESRIRALQEELGSIQPRITTAVRSAENSQLMGQLKSTLLNLQLKRTELLTKYEPGYPLVKEVDRQIADTTAAVSKEESRPGRDETTDRNPGYQLIKDELDKAGAELSGFRARAAAAREIADHYRAEAQQRDQDNMVQQNLIRDAKAQEDAYLLYVRKSEEAGISDALDRRGIVNVAIAEPPGVPIAPEHSPLFAAVLTLGLLCMGTFTTAFVLDAVDPTFRTPDEVEAYLETPVLAALPKNRE